MPLSILPIDGSLSPCVATLCDMIKSTVIKWGQATQIHDSKLIRAMFKLIYNQYDGIGEVRQYLFASFLRALASRFRSAGVSNARTSSTKTPSGISHNCCVS